jgi:hypothetical protein
MVGRRNPAISRAEVEPGVWSATRAASAQPRLRTGRSEVRVFSRMPPFTGEQAFRLAREPRGLGRRYLWDETAVVLVDGSRSQVNRHTAMQISHASGRRSKS